MNNSNKTVIDVSSLFKAYGDIVAVSGISFDVKEGEVFGMLGPNGAGKTTTVEIIEGLHKPDRGDVYVLGMNALKDIRSIKDRIGVQPQSPSLIPILNVQEVVNFFGSLYSQPISTSKVISLVSLQESRKVLVKNLSGGQRQRLSVALAFISNPDIIFLDEPTTGLDPQARRNMWDVIDYFRQIGKTIFLTTHYMEEAERLCDRVAIMDHGKIITIGRPRQIIEEHFKEAAVQFRMSDFLGEETFTSLDGVTSVIQEGDGIILYTTNVPATVSSLLSLASENSAQLSDLFIRQATLEDVFIKLTGKRIRD